MAKLITVSRAEEEVKRLQHYILLAESYEADTLEKWIVKEYAYTNSITKVLKKAEESGTTIDGKPIDKHFVTSVVNGKATDELHKLIKSGYRYKISRSKKGKSI